MCQPLTPNFNCGHQGRCVDPLITLATILVHLAKMLWRPGCAWASALIAMVAYSSQPSESFLLSPFQCHSFPHLRPTTSKAPAYSIPRCRASPPRFRKSALHLEMAWRGSTQGRYEPTKILPLYSGGQLIIGQDGWFISSADDSSVGDNYGDQAIPLELGDQAAWLLYRNGVVIRTVTGKIFAGFSFRAFFQRDSITYTHCRGRNRYSGSPCRRLLRGSHGSR